MWTVLNDWHTNSLFEVFEHGGVPVLVHGVGTYPAATNGTTTTRECAHLQVLVQGGWRNGVAYYTGVTIRAVGALRSDGRCRALEAWASTAPEEAPDYEALVAEAKRHLDGAVAVLAQLDETYAAAAARIAPVDAYRTPFTDRADYEAACAALDVPALADEECDSYGVRYGQYAYPHYSAQHIVEMHWHTYWTGPRGGERTAVLRWLPPIPVALEEGTELPAVIHPVRGSDEQ